MSLLPQHMPPAETWLLKLNVTLQRYKNGQKIIELFHTSPKSPFPLKPFNGYFSHLHPYINSGATPPPSTISPSLLLFLLSKANQLNSAALKKISESAANFSIKMAGISRAGISSVLLLVFVALSFAEARDHLVGGKSGAWKVPASAVDSLNHWAEKSRFNIGDSLVWEYDGSKDSVLQVTKRDYVTCNTSSPVETYTGGSTKVKLVRSGPHYFISGAAGNCEKGEKLIVVVISGKHRRLRISPAPSPVEIEGPAIAPALASGAVSSSGGFVAALFGALLVMV